MDERQAKRQHGLAREVPTIGAKYGRLSDRYKLINWEIDLSQGIAELGELETKVWRGLVQGKTTRHMDKSFGSFSVGLRRFVGRSSGNLHPTSNWKAAGRLVQSMLPASGRLWETEGGLTHGPGNQSHCEAAWIGGGQGDVQTRPRVHAVGVDRPLLPR